MLRFEWKRKVKSSERIKSQTFGIEKESSDSEDVIPVKVTKVATSFALEDVNGRACRLKTEGVILAEQGRYWEAIIRFNEALDGRPHDEALWEMKAQHFWDSNHLVS